MERRTLNRRKMITDTEVTNLIKYYNSFASAKQKKEITTILNKTNHTAKDIKRLKQYLFKYKCYIEANSLTVDSRINRLYRDSIYASRNNNKFSD